MPLFSVPIRLLTLLLFTLWWAGELFLLFPQLRWGWAAFAPQTRAFAVVFIFTLHLFRTLCLFLLGQHLWRHLWSFTKRPFASWLFLLIFLSFSVETAFLLQARFLNLKQVADIAFFSKLSFLLFGIPLLSVFFRTLFLFYLYKMKICSADINSKTRTFRRSFYLLLGMISFSIAVSFFRFAPMSASLESAFASSEKEIQQRAFYWLEHLHTDADAYIAASRLLNDPVIGKMAIGALKKSCSAQSSVQLSQKEQARFFKAIPPLVQAFKNEKDATPFIELLRFCKSSTSVNAAFQILKSSPSSKIKAQAASVLFAQKNSFSANADAIVSWFCQQKNLTKELQLDLAFTFLHGSDESRVALAKCALANATNAANAKVAQYALGKSEQGLQIWVQQGLLSQNPTKIRLALFRMRKLKSELLNEKLLQQLAKLVVYSSSNLQADAFATLAALNGEQQNIALKSLQDAKEMQKIASFLEKSRREPHFKNQHFAQKSISDIQRVDAHELSSAELLHCAKSFAWHEAEKCLVQILKVDFKTELDDDKQRLLEKLLQSSFEPQRLAVARAYASLLPEFKGKIQKTRALFFKRLATDKALSVRMMLVQSLDLLPLRDARLLAAKLRADEKKAVANLARRWLQSMKE